MFTQCPQCQTIFEINASHLKAANGDVRCGHCLNVFNAVENLHEELPQPDMPEYETHEPDTTDTGIAASDYQKPENQQHENQQPEHQGPDDQQPGSQHAGSQYSEVAQQEPPAWVSEQETTAATSDKTGASQDELSDEDHELSEFFSDVVADDNDTNLDYETRVKQKIANNPDERFFYGGANESLINKILDKTITEDSLSYEAEDEDVVSESDKEKETSSESTDTSTRTEAIEKAPAADKVKKKKEKKKDKKKEDKNPSIEIPPLLVEDLQKDQEEQTGHNKLWLVGSLLLLLAFVSQSIYFSRDELAKNPRYRPWLTMACQTLGCTIAVPYDISQIDIIGRDVRTHPTAPHALIAGTTLINNASFNQPYPLLTLTFSNMTGTVLAQRRFTPREYLKPGTDIKAGMKPDVPVQVQLELVDPGKDAVNYEFSAQANPRAIHPQT